MSAETLPVNQRLLFAATAAALAIGIALRLWAIGSIPLWLDEAYSAYAAAHGFGFLWHVVPRYETHPPFYYSLLRLWTLAFGNRLLALRALGLVAGFTTLVAMVPLARATAGALGWDERRRRLLTCALLALANVSIPLTEMAREVRPYPLMILAYALALVTLLRIARDLAAGRGLWTPAYAAYLALVALLLWLHTLGPFWAVALGSALLVAMIGRARGIDWAWLVGGHAIVALAYLPALLIALDQAPTWIRASWLRFSLRSAWPHLVVLYAVPGWQSIAAVGLAAAGIVVLWRRDRRLLAMLLLAAIVPAALSLLVSATVTPVFITRTLTPVAVPMLLLCAIGVSAWQGRAALIAGGVAAILWFNLLAVGIQTRAAGPPQDWYGAIRQMQRHWRPGDLILAYPNEGALPLRRALGDRGLDWPVLPLPSEVPSLDVPNAIYPTGSRGVPTLPAPQLRAIADDPRLAAPPTLWLLRLGASTYDPGDAFLRQLRRHRMIAGHMIRGPIDVVALRPSPAPDRNRR